MIPNGGGAGQVLQRGRQPLEGFGKAANAKVQPIVDEMNKLGMIAANSYTDWLVY